MDGTFATCVCTGRIHSSFLPTRLVEPSIPVEECPVEQAASAPEFRGGATRQERGRRENMKQLHSGGTDAGIYVFNETPD